MPIYEYQCSACGHEFDELQKMADEPLTKCPGCKKKKLVKLVSAPSFRLKGSGWYETDFKKDKRKNLAEDSNSPGSSGDSGGSKEKSADSKSKKAESKPKKAKKAKSAD
ncbi:MAG: FmdB family zinc ribbon protein [Gammaproteobacteria bacterium]